MNIDVFRNAVIQGQITTIESQILAWQIYGERTGEVVTDIVTELNKHITELKKLVKP